MKKHILFLVLIFSSLSIFGENMDFFKKDIKSIKIVGISLKTTNENNQAAKDIPILWDKFFKENISDKIENKKSNEIYALYTDYEGDFMKPYSVVLGHEVENFENIPEGMTAKEIPSSSYAVFQAESPKKVISAWQNIWKTSLNRKYLVDFEVYKTVNSSIDMPSIEICVGIE